MSNLFYILLFFVDGSQQKPEELQRTSRSSSVGNIIIENNTNNPVKVQVESNIVPIDIKIIEIESANQTASRVIIQEGFATILPKHTVKVYYNNFVPMVNSLARCSVYLFDLTKIIDSETVKTGEKYN